MSRRDQIRMSQDEVRAFLDEERVVTVATVNPDGRVHLVPLWFVRDGDVVEGWTYGRSQKVVNLRRSPLATLQVEAGETYDQLRGVSLECDVELVTDPDEVVRIGLAVSTRYGGERSPELEGFVRAQAAKRVGLRFTPTGTASWDHRKLGGTY
ncbi:TIGR03618 family F420-dependent PPOX class oxidoreductase [Umezawaea tangerina]|nr:TIGR03618 family F420-dependent PPOX class oxidoreductase [Umezawaea tangerina]